MTRVAVVFVVMKMHKLHSEWRLREVISQPLYVLNVAVMSFARNSGISSGVVMMIARFGFVFHAAAIDSSGFSSSLMARPITWTRMMTMRTRTMSSRLGQERSETNSVRTLHRRYSCLAP